jgi:hypothetical protein
VHILDKQYQVIVIQNEIDQNAMWAVWYWLGLFGGIILSIVSLAWIAQM